MMPNAPQHVALKSEFLGRNFGQNYSVIVDKETMSRKGCLALLWPPIMNYFISGDVLRPFSTRVSQQPVSLEFKSVRLHPTGTNPKRDAVVFVPSL